MSEWWNARITIESYDTFLTAKQIEDFACSWLSGGARMVEGADEIPEGERVVVMREGGRLPQGFYVATRAARPLKGTGWQVVGLRRFREGAEWES